MRILPAFVPSLGMAGIRVGANAFERAERANRREAGTIEERSDNPEMGSQVFLWDFETMRLIAVIADHHLHAVRAGSPSGLATRLLARADARTVGCIGSGRIMQPALTAVCGARPIEAAKVFSPNRAHREEFSEVMSHRLGLKMTPVDSAEEAVRGVDVVQIVTNQHFQAVIDGSWLEPGQHLNSITPGELDERTVLRSSLFVGTRDRALHDNPPRQPLAGMIERGTITPDYVKAELGEVIVGKHPGRTSRDEITLFMSPGVGFYDVTVATWVYRIARLNGIGNDVEA
jgi:ornithine cyclodeaminase/alanine dehydrogenase-like protein (mu-crystallin family)